MTPTPNIGSMTGFANAGAPSALGMLAAELRSVNARFLDLTLKLAEELRPFEAALRETLAARIARGKVECRISLQRASSTRLPRINEEALAGLAQLAGRIGERFASIRPLSVADALAWPGVVEAPAVDTDELRAAVFALLENTLEEFEASRRREGRALAATLLDRCSAVEAIVVQLKQHVPDMRAAQERKLTERIQQTLTPLLERSAAMSREELAERVRQEVTLAGMRADVDEELDRLAAHVAEIRRVLAAGGPAGRRLDFLMQELNREANTLGSKATAIELTQAAVELKLLIEQMREQIQNVE
jgi:uncharacterized protein (TIGR00255 family)